jgi:hypothetical protein
MLPAMRRSLSIALIAVGLAGAWMERAVAEDMQLRARAIQLLDKARAANSIRGGPFLIQTEASFVAAGDGGALVSGSYLRTRGLNGSLRQEVRFGDWQATFVKVNTEVGLVGPWDFPPYAVRRLLALVPFFVGQLDDQDVVRAIKDGGAAGQDAVCIDYDTIHGEERSANHICVSKADGSLIEVRDSGRTFEYREDSGFTFSADVSMKKLERVSDDTFVIPAGARGGTLCKTATQPVPLNAPQPAAKGGPDAPVVDVVVRAFVTHTGEVMQPHVVKPGRAELDDEAIKLVQTWTFEPSTCNGKPNTVPHDLIVHFQGR